MNRSNGKSKQVHIEVNTLPHPTKCAHCSQTFPQALPIVGAPKDTEYMQLCQAIADHFLVKHQHVARLIIENQMNFGVGISAIMTLGHVESSDDGLVKWRDLIRHRLHDFATKNRISDATIEEKVEAFEWDQYWDMDPVRSVEIKTQVITLVKEMRDILEEKGMYPLDAQTVVLAQ